MKRISHTFQTDDGRTFTATGRDAWALQALVDAGDRGCTPLDTAGPRWSGYIFKLRRAGLAIETVRERHGGNFPGHHARYVLRTPVRIVGGDDGRAGAGDG